MSANKFIYIFLAAVLVLTFSCQDKYNYANLEQEGLLAYTNGIFVPLAKYDTVAFSLALDRKHDVYFIRLTSSGGFQTKTSLTQIFNSAWRLDSLFNMDFYRPDPTTSYIALYQASKALVNNFSRLILLDTTGRVRFIFQDTLLLDSLYGQNILITAKDNQILSYYIAHSTFTYDTTYFITQRYDFHGNLLGINIKLDTQKLSVYDVYNLKGNLLVLVYNQNGSYLMRINPDKPDFDMISLGENWFTLWSLPLDSNNIVLCGEDDYTDNLKMKKIDFEAGKVSWTVDDPKLYTFVPMDYFNYNGEEVFLGFLWRNKDYYFGYSRLPLINGLFTAVSLSDGKVLWLKSYSYEKLVPLGFLKQNDTLYTSFSYGHAFSYFPATFVLKFNQYGKIFEL